MARGHFGILFSLLLLIAFVVETAQFRKIALQPAAAIDVDAAASGERTDDGRATTLYNRVLVV